MFSNTTYQLAEQWIQGVYLLRLTKAYPGKPDGSGGYTYPVSGKPGKVYVRLGTPESQTIAEAVNYGGTLDGRLLHYVERLGGEFVIMFPDPVQARELFGSNTPYTASPLSTMILSLKSTLDACSVIPATEIGGLTVRVIAGQTQHNQYQDGSTLVTLTPTATSEKASFVCIGIDANNDVVQTLSADRALAYPFYDANGSLTAMGWDDIKAVMDADRDTYWLSAFMLINGATTLDLAKQKDLRLFNTPVMTGADGVNAGAAGLVPAPTATDNVKFLRGDGVFAAVTGGGAISGDVLPSTFQARLTLESGVPVPTTDQTAKTTLYLTPFGGSVIALYDGASAWTGYTLTEISASLSGLTADTNYDVFVYDNSGTLTLDLVAWTDATTRATALTTQNGVYVKSGATARRYAGTIRTTATTGQCEDSVTKRYVWNCYQRKQRVTVKNDATDSWTYATSTWRAANNSTANRFEYVCGLNEDMIEAEILAGAQLTNANIGAVGIGIDSTSANSALVFGEFIGTSAGLSAMLKASYKGYPGAGFHYIQWLEYRRAGTVTFFGDAGVASMQSGIVGVVWG